MPLVIFAGSDKSLLHRIQATNRRDFSTVQLQLLAHLSHGHIPDIEHTLRICYNQLIRPKRPIHTTQLRIQVPLKEQHNIIAVVVDLFDVVHEINHQMTSTITASYLCAVVIEEEALNRRETLGLGQLEHILGALVLPLFHRQIDLIDRPNEHVPRLRSDYNIYLAALRVQSGVQAGNLVITVEVGQDCVAQSEGFGMTPSETLPQFNVTIPAASDQEPHFVQISHTRDSIIMRWNCVDHLAVLHVVGDSRTENKRI